MAERTGDPGESEPQTESLWLATTPTTDYEPLDGGLHVDVAIVGGGITGLSAAINLKEAGRTVAVVEAERIVESTTGHTTAKITSQHGLCYDALLSTFGREKAGQYAEANEAAIAEIADRAATMDVDPDFRRKPAYVYADSPDDLDQLRDEAEAASSLGLPATYTEETDLPFDVPGAVRFDDQAEFHPRKYLLAIAERVHGDGSYVFEETRAEDVDPGERPRVSTDRGDVVADDVIVATHFPVFDRGGYFSRMHPHRAYLLAARIEGEPPQGMYYSTAQPPATMRSAPENGEFGNGAGGPVDSDDSGPGRPDGPGDGGSADREELLIVGGQGHKPGLDGPPTSERYRRCEAFAREHFDVESVVYRWSTHDYETVDRVPFVGQLGPRTENVYVATGFKGWGISGGTAAGLILTDLIVDGSSPWADVFDPLRVTPGASAKSFVEENATVAARFFGDRAKTLLSSEAELPAPGEATIVREDGRPTAVYRDRDGEVHAVSAVCTHMKCLVRWNDAEETWDCPCHGSRFSHDGDVISGPALEPLEDREL